MKVGELIKELALQNLDAKVIMSTDAEGNAFGKLNSVEADSKIVVLWPAHETKEIEDFYE